MELPIREDLLELIRPLELPVCGFVLRVLGVFLLMELPIREDLLELIRPLELPIWGLVTCELGVLVLMELPIRDDLLELIRPLELPACGLVTCELGILVLMELTIRDDLLELIRPLELPACGLATREPGVLVLMELTMRDDLLELTRVLELPACGCVLRILGIFSVMGLPIRDDLLELIRPLELPDGVLVVTPDRIVTGRLTDVRLDLLLVLPLLGMRTFTLLVALLEPILRKELLRVELLLEEILLRLVEDLGVMVLVGALLTDRDEVVALEELDMLGDDRRLPEEEDLEVCRLVELLLLDLLLLPNDFSARIGSRVRINAKNNVPTTNLTFLGYFIVAIILLLKYLM